VKEQGRPAQVLRYPLNKVEINMEQETKEIPFQEVLEALLDESSSLNPRYLYRLSDLEGEDLDRLQATWSEISERRRLALLEDLEALQESDYVLSYEAVSCLALSDPNPKIRIPATRILWESESADLIPTFYTYSKEDPDRDVRACMASALGRYVYLGELEDLPSEIHKRIEDRLLQIASGEDDDLVRRRALESLGYSSREEVPPLILQAYQRGDASWLASALFAMGRSTDPKWAPYILEQFTHPASKVRMEAARASGEIESREAVAGLLELLEDETDDVRNAAIWSLSQIGGEGVFDALEALQARTSDDDLADFIDEALDNLVFTEDRSIFNLLGYDEKAADDFHLEDDIEASED
jgi:HEAT repeat protein